MNSTGCDADIRKNAMTLPLIEKSNYFRALLVLSRRDRIIDNEEKKLLLRIGQILDFDKRFCEATINDLLVNPNISRNLIIFTNERLKESFFRDALRVALCDGDLHPAEYRWLRQTAHANGWTNQKLESIIREFQRSEIGKNHSALFEIQKLL
jgi:hypothetical protein